MLNLTSSRSCCYKSEITCSGSTDTSNGISVKRLRLDGSNFKGIQTTGWTLTPKFHTWGKMMTDISLSPRTTKWERALPRNRQPKGEG